MPLFAALTPGKVVAAGKKAYFETQANPATAAPAETH